MALLGRDSLLALLLVGCGTPLTGSNFRGTPVYTYPGTVAWAGGALPDAGVSVALFFAPSVESVEPGEWIEDLDTTTPITGLPAPFTLNIFAWPEPSLMLQDAGGALGLGRLVGYEDTNGNGRFDPQEPILGVEPAGVWLYSPKGAAASSSPTQHAIPSGFSHVLVAQNCTPPPAVTDPGSCGVPLGNSCDVDMDCGPGHCILSTTVPWPAGYCAAQAWVGQNSCAPAEGAYAPTPLFSAVPPNVAGFWLRSCQSNADCARPGDELAYSCDVGLAGCVPGLEIPLPLGGPVVVEPFCGGGMRPPPP